MNKILIGAVAGVLGLTSVAMADRGDRYSRARSDASSRYEGGGSRGDYHRGGDRDYGRGHSDRGRSRSSFSFGFGISSGGYGSSSHFGLGYSRGYTRGYHHSPGYYRSTRVYVAPAPIYIAPPPVIYERHYYAPSYYGHSYGYGGGYYCR